MRILLVIPYFPPDQNQAALMYGALVSDLALANHEVLVLTSQPNYAATARPNTLRPFETERSGKKTLVRVFVPRLDRSRYGNRLVALLFFNILGASYVLFMSRPAVALVTGPAWQSWLMILMLRLRRVAFHFRIHDLYPEIAIRLGVVVPGSLAAGILGWLEGRASLWAQTISVVTESFQWHLGHAGVPLGKVTVVPDWVDTGQIYPSSKRNAFSLKYGLQDKCVVLYGGNVGLSQDLEILVEAARLLKNQKEIVILIIGEGAAKERLLKLSRAYQLENVVFLPFQPPESLNDIYAASDIGLVSLRPGLSPEWCPAKTYTIMASGRPVLAAVDEESETAALLRQTGAGVCVRAGAVEALADAILKLAGDREQLEAIGARGRVLAEQRYSRSVCTTQICTLLAETIAATGER